MKLASERVPIRILGWCIMSNHWHLVLWPREDGELTAFVRHLTMTHAQRWKHAHNAVGHGHLYQGRFKSFPVQDDPHLLTVLRYAERNPVRAGLVKDAGRWPWGSFYVRQRRNHPLHCLLSPLPLDLPADWSRLVNQPQNAAEEDAVKLHIARNRPMGDPAWVERIAKALKLESTLRSPGRPAGTALTK